MLPAALLISCVVELLYTVLGVLVGIDYAGSGSMSHTLSFSNPSLTALNTDPNPTTTVLNTEP